MNYRSKHEPKAREIITMVQLRRDGAIGDSEVINRLVGRDALLWLEFESFHATAWLADVIASRFRKAHFILTVRDCYSWLDSVINQHLNSKVSPHFQQLREINYGTPFQREATVLEEKGLYSLEGFLSYWARHNDFVLNAVPPERLLVVPTRGLSNHVDDIGAFAGVDPGTLNRERSHSHKAPHKHEVLRKIDSSLIKELIERLCRQTIERLEQYEFLKGYDLAGY